jgi:hypothetical protein
MAISRYTGRYDNAKDAEVTQDWLPAAIQIIIVA